MHLTLTEDFNYKFFHCKFLGCVNEMFTLAKFIRQNVCFVTFPLFSCVKSLFTQNVALFTNPIFGFAGITNKITAT